MTTGKRERAREVLGLALVAIVAGALGATQAGATSVKDLTLTQLTGEADVIVRVKVTGKESGWGRHLDRPAIVTDYAFQATSEPLVGKPVAGLTLYGGEVEGERRTLVGQPELEVGREYLLLLIQREPVQCPIVGVWKGAFELRQGQVFQGERPVVDVVEDTVLLGKDNERGMTPQAFVAELRLRLKRLQQERAEREPGEKGAGQ